MKAVKCKDTGIELSLRKKLWAMGFRYRKNCKDIFGKPDIAFKKYKLAIFCDSIFWHGYDWENKKNEIKSNKEFWYKKIEGNIKRDKTVNEMLELQGWTVLRFWENEIKKEPEACVARIIKVIRVQQKN